MPKELAECDGAADRHVAGPDGWHELAVANPTFLLERLGSECTDLQGLRELTVNGLDAIAALGADASGRVVWDLDWERFDASDGRVRKLSVIDTGTGMTAEQLGYYINQLAASGREQSRDRELRRGSKGRRRLEEPARTRIPLLAPRARLAGALQAPPGRALGARAAALGGRAQPTSGDRSAKPRSLGCCAAGSRHPGRIARRARAARHHAGAAERHRGPAAMDHPLPQRPLRAAARRRSRCWCASTTAAASPGSCDAIHGERHHVERHAVAAGAVELSDAVVHWWVLDDDASRPPSRSGPVGVHRSRRGRVRRRALRRAAADPRRVRAPSGLRHPLRLRTGRAAPRAASPIRSRGGKHRPHDAAARPRAAAMVSLGRGVRRRDARGDPATPGTRGERRWRPPRRKRSATASAPSCRSTASAATGPDSRPAKHLHRD